MVKGMRKTTRVADLPESMVTELDAASAAR